MYPDYRLPENREEYFTQLYAMNLRHGVMPGLVYLLMPKLAEHYGWDADQRLLFAFYNGMTQNPLTSMRIFERFPELPRTKEEFKSFKEWFDAEWVNLSFDTDRRHGKRDTAMAVYSYSNLVKEYGSQQKLLSGSFSELWTRVTEGYYSFGRLSSFSYLEYVKIMGFGAPCDNLFWDDKEGSKSHRNGMMFLTCHDDMVWDKRAANGFDGKYNFAKMVPWLNKRADTYLENFQASKYGHADAGYFTFESQLCQFKNGFFRRRYPGVYADMNWDRIKWYDARGFGKLTEVFKGIRSAYMLTWLREECEKPLTSRDRKAKMFADTGVPFRAEHFMEEV